MMQAAKPLSLSHTKSVLFIPLSLTLTSGLYSLDVSAKNYTRSCTAQYNVTPTSIHGTGLQRTFTGKGTVGSYMPNTARKRARRNLDQCITAHWNNRNSGRRPDACTPANQVYNYPFRMLHAEIANAICAANPGHSSITVGINVLYSGDKGCTLDNNSWMRRVASNYLLNCPTSDHENNVDRPGRDYSDRVLMQNSWRLCQSYCDADSRCMAWTYVRPGHQGPRAKCWLKDAVPAPRPNSCCVSGVKEVLH